MVLGFEDFEDWVGLMRLNYGEDSFISAIV
mgnify:CR=1 FL=1